MHDRLGFSIGSVFAAVIPLACGIAGALISNMPISIFGGNLQPPLLALMPVYFWCLIRPDLMPPWIALALGILEDMLSGGSPGVWTAAFVASYALVDRQRESFAGLAGFGAIIGFAAAMFAASATAYLVEVFLAWRFLPISALIVQFAVTIVFYIPGAALLNLIHRRLVGPLRSEF
jgi:rod shape-determining protein MreD